MATRSTDVQYEMEKLGRSRPTSPSRSQPRSPAGRGGIRLLPRVLPRVGQPGRLRGRLREEPRSPMAAGRVYHRAPGDVAVRRPVRPRVSPRASRRSRFRSPLARASVARSPPHHAGRGNWLSRHDGHMDARTRGVPAGNGTRARSRQVRAKRRWRRQAGPSIGCSSSSSDSVAFCAGGGRGTVGYRRPRDGVTGDVARSTRIDCIGSPR